MAHFVNSDGSHGIFQITARRESSGNFISFSENIFATIKIKAKLMNSQLKRNRYEISRMRYVSMDSFIFCEQQEQRRNAKQKHSRGCWPFDMQSQMVNQSELGSDCRHFSQTVFDREFSSHEKLARCKNQEYNKRVLLRSVQICSGLFR